ncbi:MAG TPA: LEA type 2 family protein [Planctomycetota bacterium]|nr:LEA type 2 family protein [Planctomycetota bacterium]
MAKALFLLAAILAGCVAPKRDWTYQACKLELTDVLREKQVDQFSVEVTFQFRVRNPNPIPVRLERLRLSVQAAGIDLGVTALPNRPIVGPSATEIIRVPMMINTHAAPGSLGAVDKKATVFRFVGRLAQVGLYPDTGRDNPAHSAEFPIDAQGSPE